MQKGLKVVEVDMLAKFSSGECSGPWAFCLSVNVTKTAAQGTKGVDLDQMPGPAV